MSKLQKTKILTPFIDYIPAELKERKTWVIEYYAIDPYETNPSKRLKRRRNRVKPMVNKTERRKFAKRIITNLNTKLAEGWTPFINEENKKSFTELKVIFEVFLKEVEQQIKKDVLRPDTLRAYNSYTNNFKKYLIDIRKENLFVNEFKEKLCRDFLNVIFFERNNSAKTHNNYLTFLGIISKWMIRKQYISNDPTKSISKIKETEKKRQIIPKTIRELIFKHFLKTNKGYHVLCLVAYYCLIRRTELTKLKVSDVILKNGIISIPGTISKNKKTQIVTIPLELMNFLVNHLNGSKNSDYLFSENKFKTGQKQLDPKKISDTWSKMRKALNIDDSYQWYSLKDTGITNYLQLGIPTIDVKNQARHHSISQTETYIPKTIMKAVDNIQLAKLNF